MSQNTPRTSKLSSFLRTYRYLLGTVLVAAFLVIPWGLSVLSPALEPYPAVIMPSGETTVSLESDSLDYERQSVWVQTQNDTWERLEVSDFLAPVPTQYFYAVRGNEFGLKGSAGTETLPFRLLPDLTVKRSKITEEEAAAAKVWLADNLERLGYKSERFEIRTHTLNIDRQTGETLERGVKNVESYHLR